MPCPNHPEVVSGLVVCARCGVKFCSDCVVELDGNSYDAACKEEQIRDLKSGATADLDLASAWRRFAGSFVDGLVIISVVLVVMFLFRGRAGSDGLVLRSLISAAFGLVYEGLMLTSGGQTLGKKAVGTKVVNADGSDIQAGQAWTRAISRQVMALTQILGVVDALMVFSRGHRTLHDRFGKTLVVKLKR
jgi:uncharacterized RDD family membrane protein YckC